MEHTVANAHLGVVMRRILVGEFETPGFHRETADFSLAG
jgi:hypothetical protein